MDPLPPLTLDDVAPEMRTLVRRLPRLPFDRAWVRRLARAAQRLLPAKRVAGVRVEARRELRGIRIHRPDALRSPAAVFWIHGGGYIIGRPAQDDPLCGATAAALGVAVIAPAYRLAPEHRFPAALDDLTAAWHWLLDHSAALGIDPARIVVAGESAGGGLAAALVQRIHDAGGVQPVGQWLFCPMLDDRTAARRELDPRRHFLWDNRLNAVGWRAYLGVEPGAPTLPNYAVPARRQNLAGLPPAWIGVGSIDLFRDEDVAYAARLEEAGVPVRLFETPGGIHAFNKVAPEAAMSRAYVADAFQWLETALGG